MGYKNDPTDSRRKLEVLFSRWTNGVITEKVKIISSAGEELLKNETPEEILDGLRELEEQIKRGEISLSDILRRWEDYQEPLNPNIFYCENRGLKMFLEQLRRAIEMFKIQRTNREQLNQFRKPRDK